MVREDGVKLLRLGAGRERQQFFLYSDHQIEFEVTATRYDADGSEITDTWDVYLGLALQSLSGAAQPQIPSLDRVRGIARNIEDALRAWPPRRGESGLPIRRVIFHMKPWQSWNPALGDAL